MLRNSISVTYLFLDLLYLLQLPTLLLLSAPLFPLDSARIQSKRKRERLHSVDFVECLSTLFLIIVVTETDAILAVPI